MLIDERIKHCGVSKLRKLNTESLRVLKDCLIVLQDGDEPIAVLLSYDLFMEIQGNALAKQNQVRL